MTESKTTGIKVHNVFVTKLDFEHYPGRENNNALNLTIGIETKMLGPKKLEERVTVTITNDKDPNKTSFRLVVTVLGLFEEMPGGAPITLERFSKLQALAILFPYVREVVMSTTARAPMAPVLLPTMNLTAIIEDGEGATQVEQ